MNYQEAESLAPIKTDEALPPLTNTLEFVPEAKRQQYQRTMDGLFRLEWILSDDAASMKAYSEQIASKELAVHPEGTTRAALDLAAKESEIAQEKFQQLVDEMTAAEIKTRRDAAMAAVEKKKAELAVMFERQAAAYKPWRSQ